MQNIIDFNDFEKLNESNQNMDYNDRENMISLSKTSHGIENITIWVGPNKKYNSKIVKVSNKLNDKKGEDCFTITLSDLKILGQVDENIITSDVLLKIKNFLIKNRQEISYFYDNINNYSLKTFIKKLILMN